MAYDRRSRSAPSIRRTLTVSQPKSTPVTPAVDSITMRAERLLPFCEGCLWMRFSKLPLDSAAGDDADSLDLPKNKTIGILSGEDGDTASVSWTGEATKLDDGGLALQLKVDGLDRPATYEGKIDFQPDDEKKGEVTVKAVYTHVGLAFLVLGSRNRACASCQARGRRLPDHRSIDGASCRAWDRIRSCSEPSSRV